MNHRVGKTTLRLTTPDGSPLSNSAVTVRQTCHAMLFGCSEFSVVPYANNRMAESERATAERRYELMGGIFNAVTLPFYWGRFEPEQGHPDTEGLLNAARFLQRRGFTLKGHPLCWHTGTAPWLLNLSDADILTAQLERIRRDMGGFAGLIDLWDVINEVVIMPVFDKYDNGITRICHRYGAVELVKRVFDEAKAANASAKLLINDFNTSEAYATLIEQLLDAGVPIDIIGIQSHMHQGFWGADKTQEILHRFSRFNLPLHFTEISLVSGQLMPPEIDDLNDFHHQGWPSTPEGEQRQAEEAASFYNLLYEHPLVQAITWWSFHDGLWLDAPSGLITSDAQPKPVYDALKRLIKSDWWTGEKTLMTDADGHLHVEGTKGGYRAAWNGGAVEFTVP